MLELVKILKTNCSIFLLFCCAGCAIDAPDVSITTLLTLRSGWTVVSATENGTSVHEFDGMRLLFSPTDFSTSLFGSEVWPACGEYSLEEQSSRILVRDDGTEIFVTSIDQQILSMEFQFKGSELTTGRTEPRNFYFTFQPSK